MAYTQSYGYTDTQSTPISVNIPDIDYGADYALQTMKDREVVLVNTTTPADQPYTVRRAIQRVNNVYESTDIDPTLWSPQKRGLSFLNSVRLDLRDTNTETGAFVDYPITCNISFKWPVNSHITAAHIRTAVDQAYAHLIDDDGGNTVIDKAMRGALLPSDLS